MSVYRRLVALPLELTAPNPAAADRHAADLAGAAADRIEALDAAGSLTVGPVTVTTPPARYLVAYGAGQHATARVGQWLSAGAVDSCLVRGTWVHRPAGREDGTGAAA